MRLRQQLLVSFTVQGAGAASVLLATAWVGSKLGPEVQGLFNRTKSEVEFVAAFAMFGLPQALFFFVKSGRVSWPTAMHWVVVSTLFSAGVALIYGVIRHLLGQTFPVAWFVPAVVMCVAHGQLRALLLVREPTAWFNALTALPQLWVLVSVVWVVTSSSALGGPAASLPVWCAIFMSAYGSAAVIAWFRLRPAAADPLSSTASWRQLAHYGLAAWLTAALSTAAILVMQHQVGSFAGASALGLFTMAMTWAQVPLTPIAYAAPLLFRRWMEAPGARAPLKWAGALFVFMTSVAVLVWFAASMWPDMGLGPAYSGSTRALAVLLGGTAAEGASRLLAVQANARGSPWLAVRAETARWIALGMGWCLPLQNGLLSLCAVWSFAACVAALVFAWNGRRGITLALSFK